MKKVFMIMLLLIASINLIAQQNIKGEYFTQPDLNKFVGKWVYTDDTISFTVELRNEKVHVNKGQSDFYIDMIQGDYILKKNNRIIQSSIGKDAAITSGTFADKKLSLTKLTFVFTDLGKKSNRGSVTFELLSNNPNKAKWIIMNTEHIVVGNEHYDPTFSIPRNMILKRVE